jgi:transcriptional regulator with XRE-family HTH domain
MGRRHEPQEALGRAILQLRDERGMTQAALARAADTDNTRISHLENGRTNPAWGTVRRIAAALDVPVSKLAALAEELEGEGGGARRDGGGGDASGTARGGEAAKPKGPATGRRGRRGPSRPRP